MYSCNVANICLNFKLLELFQNIQPNNIGIKYQIELSGSLCRTKSLVSNLQIVAPGQPKIIFTTQNHFFLQFKFGKSWD